MHPSPRKPLEDLDELRRLLMPSEEEELRNLRDRLDDKEQRAREIASVLPKAVALSAERGEELAGALRPVVRRAIAKNARLFLRSLAQTSQSHRGSSIALAALMGGIVAALIVAARSEMHWHDFMRRLNSAPGIAITEAEKNWIRSSRVAGLRDPAVADPAAVARAAGIDPGNIRFEWKDYLALDDESVLRRFAQRFGKPAGADLSLTKNVLTISGAVPYEWVTRVERDGLQSPGLNSITKRNITLTYDPGFALERFRRAYPPPVGVTAAVDHGTLLLSGTAPYEWIAPVRAGARKLPGIRQISEEKLLIAYDSRLVLERFSERFHLPDGVNTTVEKGVLVLFGEAPHGWLTRVRRGAPAVPGIDKIDERNLIDLDQRTYQQSKSVIESAFVYFLPNEDSFAAEGFAALSRLPDEIRRCLTATSRLGLKVEIEVRGYAEPVGDEAKDFDLSQRRAEAVRDFLIKSGLESTVFKALGMGASAAADAPAPEQADRRVALKVAPKL